MKRFMIPAAVLLTVLILTGGFFLPTIVSQYTDRRTIGELTITDGSGVSYETKTELKTVDRLKMVTNAGRIELDNGKNMDAVTAYQSALKELGKFNDNGIMDMDLEACKLTTYSVSILIDSSDPSKSLIVWELLIQNESYDVYTFVDDETGMLLAMQFYINELAYKNGKVEITRPHVIVPADAESPSAAADSSAKPSYTEQIGVALADYYGLTLVGSKPQKSDYYTRLLFELSDGQDSVLLPVSFTYAGFTLNS